MGKNLIVQARGKGGLNYQAHPFRAVTELQYPRLDEGTKGRVIDLIDDPIRSAPLAVVDVAGKQYYFLASETLKTGDIVEFGGNAPVKIGNVMAIGKVPEGVPVFNVESKPTDGGTMVRTTGTYATVVSKGVNETVLKMPSGQLRSVGNDCRVTIGMVAGGERLAKPIVKAGKNWHIHHARGKLYPRSKARAMNAVDHPFGGSNLGKAKTSSRHAPPGRKVGHIAAKRTGRKNRN